MANPAPNDEAAASLRDQVSSDGLIDGRVRLLQPLQGYRAGSDAILLAAAVPISGRQRVLDAGAGVGAVSICLACLNRQVLVAGIEIQLNLVRLAGRNVEHNCFNDRVEIISGDITCAPSQILTEQFDHVVCNPPFYSDGKATASPDPGKAIAHGEGMVPLTEWISFCVKRALPGGSITFIHRAERLPDMLTGLGQAGAGDIRILPLWPGPGRPAKRVIVQALAQRRGSARLLSGITLHNDDGGETEDARRLLRHGYRIDLTNAGDVISLGT
jgi:tRNA1(Val) A37 N6-methylase TrmN6